MALPLLQSKLFIPPARPAAVPRPRLLAKLSDGLYHRLTLVSAPAGFGKTTLISEWAAGIDRPVAWVSLDAADNDPSRFLTYLVAALQVTGAPVGAGLLDALQSPQPPPPESVVMALLNGIGGAADPVLVVLDDYHVIESSGVDHALAFLLEHLPRQMHLVLITRADPPLPLARLRAQDRLTELRAADLRFSPAEAATFLNQVMGLTLSESEVAALDERTEGWIAGLQLAALSMRGREDIPGFIRAFRGDHRFVVDYLVEEVLQRQPGPVRQFLLQTSVLDRLHGPLCDAVTGQEGGSARLAALERGNYFVVPLDDERHWFRYHHLFGDVLRAHLLAEQPDQVAALHQRASAWYDRHGSVPDAIRHALAAKDVARAADMIEQVWPAIRRGRQEAMMRAWLAALPDHVLRDRPVLSAASAHVLLATGELEGAPGHLRAAERWLDTPAGTGARARMVVVDEAEFRRLPATIALARAGLALAGGDVPGSRAHAQRALDLAPADDHLTRGGAAGFLGLAAWTSGDLETAHRTYAAGMASLQRAGNLPDVINGALHLATIRLAQGRLSEAMHTYERALQLATEPHPGMGSSGARSVLRGAADIHVGLSELYLERDDLATASAHLRTSKELGEHAGFAQNRYRWRVAMARLREAQGDLSGALELLHEAARLYVSDFSPNVRPIVALVARTWIKQGRLGEALGWARAQGLPARDGLDFPREFEHLTLARVLLARHAVERAEHALPEALDLLERILSAADAGGRTGNVLEVLILQALAHQARGDNAAALAPLHRALMLAEPEGYVRLFMEEGPPMVALLERAHRHGITPAYTRHLLSASGRTTDKLPPIEERARGTIEPLSERELDVLRLLASDLTGPEIAGALVVSLSTLRTHTQNIYGKLGVHNRRAAVRRAMELALL